jgi:hypothetical protein
MGNENDTSATSDSAEEPSHDGAPPLAKALRLEKEKQELLASLANADFSGMRTKVAAVLYLYPHARNSNVALA